MTLEEKKRGYTNENGEKEKNMNIDALKMTIQLKIVQKISPNEGCGMFFFSSQPPPPKNTKKLNISGSRGRGATGGACGNCGMFFFLLSPSFCKRVTYVFYLHGIIANVGRVFFVGVVFFCFYL